MTKNAWLIDEITLTEEEAEDEMWPGLMDGSIDPSDLDLGAGRISRDYFGVLYWNEHESTNRIYRDDIYDFDDRREYERECRRVDERETEREADEGKASQAQGVPGIPD